MPEIYIEHDGKMVPLTTAKIDLSEVESEPLLKLKDMEGTITLTSETTNLSVPPFIKVVEAVIDFINALAEGGIDNARRIMKRLIREKYGKSFRSARKAAAYYERLKGREKPLEEA